MRSSGTGQGGEVRGAVVAEAGGSVQRDAERALDTMEAGGIAILPLDVAYAVVATQSSGIKRIFAIKNRSYEKPSGMFATWEMSRELHLMPEAHHAIAPILVEEYGVPFS